ncbi:flavin reductase family protein [Streptomyces sp. NPDC048297]|uniref:flavin reductase family protein n=1 Tax=Streptomyces sp. NPDC048297 TaxID=3365531 RepID=UPI003716393E
MSTASTDRMAMSPMVDLTGHGIEADHFRSLAAALPTGVTVVTTLTADGAPVGMTSGAVCGLSCEPPLVLTCITRGSRTLGEIKRRRGFCVNVLASGADAISQRFASAGGDRFTGVDWRPGPGGLPVLSTGTTAHAVCELYQVVPGGDHEIVIGLIVAGDSDPSASPLVYHRRTYAGLDTLV